MYLSEKKLLFITVGIAFLVAIGLAVLGIVVLRKNLKQVQGEIVIVDGNISQAQEQRKQMDALINEVKDLEREKKSFEESLPLKNKYVYETFVDTLNKIIRDTNIKLKSASPGKETRYGPPGSQPVDASFEKISYDLQVEGEFFELIRFVSVLEEHPRFIKVNSFTLTPQDLNKVMETGKLKHNMNIRITTYVYSGK